MCDVSTTQLALASSPPREVSKAPPCKAQKLPHAPCGSVEHPSRTPFSKLHVRACLAHVDTDGRMCRTPTSGRHRTHCRLASYTLPGVPRLRRPNAPCLAKWILRIGPYPSSSTVVTRSQISRLAGSDRAESSLDGSMIKSSRPVSKFDSA